MWKKRGKIKRNAKEKKEREMQNKTEEKGEENGTNKLSKE